MKWRTIARRLERLEEKAGPRLREVERAESPTMGLYDRTWTREEVLRQLWEEERHRRKEPAEFVLGVLRMFDNATFRSHLVVGHKYDHNRETNFAWDFRGWTRAEVRAFSGWLEAEDLEEASQDLPDEVLNRFVEALKKAAAVWDEDAEALARIREELPTVGEAMRKHFGHGGAR